MSAAHGVLIMPSRPAALNSRQDSDERVGVAAGVNDVSLVLAKGAAGEHFSKPPFYLRPARRGRVKYHVMQNLIIRLVIVFTAFFSPFAHAALSCEQLLLVSQTTISLRDQGHSLSSVLAEVERGDIRQKLDAQEVNLLRQIVRISFTSEYSPREILEACQAGTLGIPKSK